MRCEAGTMTSHMKNDPPTKTTALNKWTHRINTSKSNSASVNL
jgi:hypothetical protein